jgi:hypothetical protein
MKLQYFKIARLALGFANFVRIVVAWSFSELELD